MIETAQNTHRDIASQSPSAIYGQVRLELVVSEIMVDQLDVNMNSSCTQIPVVKDAIIFAYEKHFNKERPGEHQQTVWGSPVKLPCNSNRLKEREGMAHACSSASVRV